MKILLITDQHFGVRNDNQHFIDHYRKFYDEVVIPFVDANKIDKEAGVTQECGEMDKRLNVQQLPKKLSEKCLSISRDLKLTRGMERRLFVRVTQEDGHQAWTSPFYILQS